VHAFAWRRGTGMVDLGTGPLGVPGIGSIAVSVNERGDVVGYVKPCSQPQNGTCSSFSATRAVLWRKTN
jgi:hypothetical protein